jgi:hypothetical protein
MVRPCVARGFVDLTVAVLHQCIRPLIGACRAPGHHGYQRACNLVSGQASTGPFGSPVFACAGKTEPPSLLILSQTSAGKACRSDYVIAGSSRAVCDRRCRMSIRPAERQPHRSSSLRSSGHEPERSRRCGPACWRAQLPARCGAAASWRLRSKA